MLLRSVKRNCLHLIVQIGRQFLFVFSCTVLTKSHERHCDNRIAALCYRLAFVTSCVLLLIYYDLPFIRSTRMTQAAHGMKKETLID